METPNTFTYRHSEMPPITDEMKSEIAEIDFNVANLILRFQGNYRALSELAEVLVDCLDTCEMNLQLIRIIPDGEASPRAISLTDLPMPEKQIVVSTAITSTVAVQVIAGIFGCDFDRAASQIRDVGQTEFGSMSDEDIEKVIKQLAQIAGKEPDGSYFRIKI